MTLCSVVIVSSEMFSMIRTQKYKMEVQVEGGGGPVGVFVKSNSLYTKELCVQKYFSDFFSNFSNVSPIP